jgi:hypothetical protein
VNAAANGKTDSWRDVDHMHRIDISMRGRVT